MDARRPDDRSAAVRADRIEREWFCKRCGNSVRKLQGSWGHIRNQHSPKSCGRKLTDNDVYRLPLSRTRERTRTRNKQQEAQDRLLIAKRRWDEARCEWEAAQDELYLASEALKSIKNSPPLD